MRIVVCIKPVKSELVYPNELRNESYLMNPYDLYALESCIELKKQMDCKIICLCMGPKDSEYMLTKALAMGADDAVLLNDKEFIGSDTVATTYILSKAISMIGNIDMVVCGEKSIDGETGQVVFGLSERLNYLCISGSESIIEVNEEQIVCKINNKDTTTSVSLKFPIVISFNNFKLKQPNISLLALKKAKKKEIIVWGASEIKVDVSKCGTNGSKTKVLNINSEIKKKGKAVIEGTITDKAKLILDIVCGQNKTIR